MSKAKRKTVEAPRPSKEELEAKLLKAETDAISLRWALKKATVRSVIEELRRDMMQAETFLKVTSDELYLKADGSDEGLYFMNLSDTFKLYSEWLHQTINETDPCYMDRLPGGKT